MSLTFRPDLRWKPESRSASPGDPAVAGGGHSSSYRFMLRLLVGFPGPRGLRARGLHPRGLHPRGRWLVLASALALGGTSAHGCLPAGDCKRLRSCAPSGGTPGIVETWSGGSQSLAGGEGGGGGEGAGEGGLGGLGGWGGTLPEVPPVAPGDECSPNGLYACAGHAKPDQLVCANGYFVDYGRCPLGQYCDTRPATSGLCQPIVPECEGHLASDLVCRGLERLRCGADLVTADSLGTCDDLCWEGECVECSPEEPPTCEFNSVRSCTADGHWQIESCDADTPHCSDGECGVPPSCLELEPTCGIDEDEVCCASPVVTGGPVDDNPRAPTVSSFRLDRFEVTVGRFRAFREAWDGGWRPEVGSGKHAHLNGGLGLAVGGAAMGHEAGWTDSYLSWTDPSDENLLLDVNPNKYATWTLTVGENDERPINFTTGAEAYAFCIWDHGFLPSNAEWTRVANGGDEARLFPWGDYLPELDFALAVYGCYFPDASTCEGDENIASVGTARGESAFGQLDLAGNLAERVVPSPSSGCNDCVTTASVPPANGGHLRGGAFDDSVNILSNDAFEATSDFVRARRIGFRCARSP